MKVWDAISGQEPFVFTEHTQRVNCVAFSPDGDRLASGSDDCTVHVWDGASGRGAAEPCWTYRAYFESLSFSPDGKWLATASSTYGDDGDVRVWNLQSGEEVRMYEGMRCVAFTPTEAALPGADGNSETIDLIQIRDTSNYETLITLDGEDNSYADKLAFSPDGERLVAPYGLAVAIWDSMNGELQLTLKGHSNMVRSAVYSPNENLIGHS